MHISDLVIAELKLTDAKENQPYVTANGVTCVELEANEGNYRVHLVRDNMYQKMVLEEGSKLAAFYDSRFWNEAVKATNIHIPCARFETAFQVVDADQRHAAFITKFQKGKSLITLEMEQLEQVAVEIARIQTIQSENIRKEFDTAVKENYSNIRSFRNSIQFDLVDVMEQALKTEVVKYFTTPTTVLANIKTLARHVFVTTPDEDEDVPKVFTHGKLTPDCLRFDDDGKLVEITDWENIHLGNPAEDLTSLILTSADPDIRRNKFMRVFQFFYYALADIHPPKYQLSDLKRWFRENHTRIVVDEMEALLILLAEEGVPEEKKIQYTRRWETSLNDAVDFLTDNYHSDNEQAYFSHK